jgi:hypothetical protein
MLKKVKTKNSAPGRASVGNKKVEKKNILDIFSGSDSDSTENSKAFDNPQEERGYDSSQGANASPDMPLPVPGNPGRTGASWESPNFTVNTGVIKEKPSEQLGMQAPTLSEKANSPLTQTSTRDSSITNLGSTKMSKAVVEKYPMANDVARKNASFPSDFSGEINPLKSGFNADFFPEMGIAKNNVFQSVREVPFDRSNTIRQTMKTQSDEDIKKLMNPETQGDTFTEQARTSIPGDFLTTSDISKENVFSSYSSQTGEAGQGKFSQTKEASTTMTDNSAKAANSASPQRAADALDSANGKSTFKSGSNKEFEAKVDTSVKDKVTGASGSGNLSAQGTNTTSLGDSSKSFFLSNFGGIPGGITSGMDESAVSTDSVSSTEFPSSL